MKSLFHVVVRPHHGRRFDSQHDYFWVCQNSMLDSLDGCGGSPLVESFAQSNDPKPIEFLPIGKHGYDPT